MALTIRNCSINIGFTMKYNLRMLSSVWKYITKIFPTKKKDLRKNVVFIEIFVFISSIQKGNKFIKNENIKRTCTSIVSNINYFECSIRVLED